MLLGLLMPFFVIVHIQYGGLLHWFKFGTIKLRCHVQSSDNEVKQIVH